MKKNFEKIDKIMKIFEDYYNYRKRTTLNRMKQLKNPSPFKILIGCLISLRTRDETTEKVLKKLFKIADSPKKIIKLPTKKLKKIIYSSGHYKKKTKILKYVSNELIEKFNGQVPRTKKELLSIKGIGPKTANIVLCFAYNRSVIPVDTNVHRISNRMGIVKTKTPEKTEKQLEKALPKKYWKKINGLFILHGKNICIPIYPKCDRCPVNKYCLKII